MAKTQTPVEVPALVFEDGGAIPEDTRNRTKEVNPYVDVVTALNVTWDDANGTSAGTKKFAPPTDDADGKKLAKVKSQIGSAARDLNRTARFLEKDGVVTFWLRTRIVRPRTEVPTEPVA